MMQGLILWWNGRTAREQAMLAVMLALLAVVLLFGLYRWSENRLRDAALAHLEAVERHGEVTRKIAWLKQLSRRSSNRVDDNMPLEQYVGQSAGEAGFTLDRVQARGNDAVEIAIASARSTALLGWIATLENEGVAVEKAMVTPSGATGTVSAQISFRRSGAGR